MYRATCANGTSQAFLCNIPTHLVSCRKLDFFEPAGCQSPSDMTGQLISLYYSFSADVATDLAGTQSELTPSLFTLTDVVHQ